MASAEFAGGMDELLVLAARSRIAMMCAEALWWRCHRALIADVLSTGGVEVLHILARIMRGRLSYAVSGTT